LVSVNFRFPIVSVSMRFSALGSSIGGGLISPPLTTGAGGFGGVGSGGF
jgi:hypothetical protein